MSESLVARAGCDDSLAICKSAADYWRRRTAAEVVLKTVTSRHGQVVLSVRTPAFASSTATPAPPQREESNVTVA